MFRSPSKRSSYVALIALAVCAVGCSSDDDGAPLSPPATPATAPVTDAAATSVVVGTSVPEPPPVTRAADVVLPDGFTRVAATVTTAEGEQCELCLWLADTPSERADGLMFVTDLGPADGMAFLYPRPHTGRFWMKNTVLPLSIAFFDPDGAYLDAFDMEPCTADPCPPYPTPAGFTVAIETERGGLEELGIGPGSTLELDDLPCPIAP